MAELIVRTKGNADPTGKPRVYFVCHPDDFEQYFESLCRDLFWAQDCAVYYTAAPFDGGELLGGMNLVAVSVTHRLLTGCVLDELAFAKENGIPILPFMMETGLDTLYAAHRYFAELQYLSPYLQDDTAISYKDKLKQYLNAVLVSRESEEKIRSAFDAQIFLSYRKKDRRYVNELMRSIHALPDCRSLAIWYDEYLTLGESFRDNIEKAMEKSQLFVLLVTPRLLETPNYVADTEYPAAQKSKIPILPIEMEKTDRAALKERFDGLSDPLTLEDGEALRSMLLPFVKKSRAADPERDYTLGLAYLYGVDVEIDRAYALSLITSAAERRCVLAQAMLYRMYTDGIGVKRDYAKAVDWCERALTQYRLTLGEDDELTLSYLNALVCAYEKAGQFDTAVTYCQSLCKRRSRVLGKTHPDTQLAYDNLAYLYGAIGNYEEACRLREKSLIFWKDMAGEESHQVIRALHGLAGEYLNLGSYEKANLLSEAAYQRALSLLGDEHPDTLSVLSLLSLSYGKLGQYEKNRALNEECYATSCRIYGDEHPFTMTFLGDLAMAHYNLGAYDQACRLQQKAYDALVTLYGEGHPDTLISLGNLAMVYVSLGEYEKAFAMRQKQYDAMCRTLGEEHPDTLTALHNLADCYSELGERDQALHCEEKAYHLCQKVLGEEHPDTLKVCHNLCAILWEADRSDEAVLLCEALYEKRCRVLGENHPDTLITLLNLASFYDGWGECEKALMLKESVYAKYRMQFGDEHPHTLSILNNLAVSEYNLGRYESAKTHMEQVFKTRYTVLGREHPDTAAAWQNYVAICNKIGS